MSEIKRQEVSFQASADNIWRAINTPIHGELGKLVNPFVEIEYEDLSEEGLIRQGTLIVYRPVIAELKPKLGMITDALPKDIAMRVKEHNPQVKSRVDMLESDKHSGFVSHNVGEGLLVVEGEMSLGGSKRMFEATIASYAERGLAAHGQCIADHLPAILDR